MTSIEALKEALGTGELLEGASLSQLTTFRCGGSCRVLVYPESRESLIKVMKLLRENGDQWFFLGRGSNLLVSDSGFPGVMVSLRKSMAAIRVEGNLIYAEAGAMMGDIARAALEHSLKGFEFASGIPGTIGGGLMMNAGAYGRELCDCVKEADVLMPDGEIRTFSKEQLELSYRHSVLEENSGIVLSAVLELEAGESSAIRAEMDDLNSRRRDKQPLEYGSAGSTFKRPEGYFAGKLIQDAGLKGFQIGQAAVSEKHAGFVINLGGASASDVYRVILHVKKTVKDMFGVELKPEVKFLGDF